MKKSVFLILLVTFFSFVISANGDVPPDPGQKRITLKFIVESQEDLSDYRFFLKTGAELKEYVFKKGEKMTIESMGGGAFYRNGKFLAVPKKALLMPVTVKQR